MTPPVAAIQDLSRRSRIRILANSAIVVVALSLIVALVYVLDHAALTRPPSEHAAPSLAVAEAIELPLDSAAGTPVLDEAIELPPRAELNDLQRRVAAIRQALDNAVAGKSVEGVTYIPLASLIATGGADLRWDVAAGTGASISDDGLIRFAADTSRIVIDGREARLEAPVRMLTGEPWVPIDAAAEILGGTVVEDEETGLVEATVGESSLRVIIPERLFHIEICRGGRWLRVHYAGSLAKEYPICSGKGNNTPIGHFQIQNKAVWPSWLAYWGEDIPGGSRRNPLGARWLGTTARGRSTGRAIGIHGTNQPSSIGRRISGGCIRTYNRYAIELYETIPIGARVWIHE